MPRAANGGQAIASTTATSPMPTAIFLRMVRLGEGRDSPCNVRGRRRGLRRVTVSGVDRGDLRKAGWALQVSCPVRSKTAHTARHDTTRRAAATQPFPALLSRPPPLRGRGGLHFRKGHAAPVRAVAGLVNRILGQKNVASSPAARKGERF